MRMFIRSFGILICLCLLLSKLPVCAQASVTGEAYNQLPSEMHKQAYLILEDGIASLSPVITFPDEMVIYYTDLNIIARAVCVDHPEYFWFLESWYYNYEAELGKRRINFITPSYFLDGEQVSAGSQALADAIIAFHAKVGQIITGIPVNCTNDYDIALYLHDYLIDHVTYSLEGNHDSAYSALIHGQAACYGYSKAYQYLLSAAGIRAGTITGESLDAEGNEVGHAWNQVWIDDACYYTDVTWDDMEIAPIHAYFLMSLDVISQDHTPQSSFVFPDCSHTLNFHEKNQGKGVAYFNSQTKSKTAAQYFYMKEKSETTAVFVCEIRFDGNFTSWLNKYSGAIADQLGLSYNTLINYYYYNDVYYLILTDSAYKQPKITTESITLNLTEAVLTGVGAQAQLQAEIAPDSAAWIPLSFTSSDESVAVVSSTGMVTALGVGTATITATSVDGNVNASCSVTVIEGRMHSHTLRKLSESDPNCTQDGSDSHYLCTSCGRRFSDETAEQELKSTKDYARPAAGHQDISWSIDGSIHMQVCSCGKEFRDTYGTHQDLDEDLRCDICNGSCKKLPIGTTGSASRNKKQQTYTIPILIGVSAAILIPVAIIIIKRRR